jgi:hypothetical protein
MVFGAEPPPPPARIAGIAPPKPGTWTTEFCGFAASAPRRSGCSTPLGCPIRGRPPRLERDTVVPVTRTRALAIDADARHARDNVAALMTWAIGITGICLMLAIDMLMFQAV